MKKMNRREFIKLTGLTIASFVIGLKALAIEPAMTHSSVTYENVEESLRRMMESAAKASEYIFLFGNEAIYASGSFDNFSAAVNRPSDQKGYSVG